MSETVEKVALILFGAVLGVMLPPIRDFFAWLLRRPRVRIEMGTTEGFFPCTQFAREVEDMRGDGGFPPNITRVVRDDGRYVRLRVTNGRRVPWNRQTAQGCVGYLAAVDRWDVQRQEFVNAGYDDFLRLAWSHNGEVRGMDILPDTPHWLDVLYALEGFSAFFLGTVERPIRYLGGFEPEGYYRLIVQVSGENIRSKQIPLYLRWTGKWQTMQVMDPAEWRRQQASIGTQQQPVTAAS